MAEEKEPDAENLKKELEECQKLKDEYLAGWQRARADLLNYKKDEKERVGDVLKYACDGLILKMLPLLDNFDVALKHLPDQGFSQIRKQFQDFLKDQDVEEIKSVGEKFDPNLHEVVKEIETEDKESGVVLEEVQKGYKINGRLLRPAKVKISK